jgi:hypothetical protein
MKLTGLFYPYAISVRKRLGPHRDSSALLGYMRPGLLVLGRYFSLEVGEGIYQTRPSSKGRVQVFEKFYRPTDPKTSAQLARRAVFANAISEWQGFAPEVKALYNQRASGMNLSGYNLFIREWLESH